MKNILLSALMVLLTTICYSQTDETNQNDLLVKNNLTIQKHKYLTNSINLKEEEGSHEEDKLQVSIGGYLETFYSYNFNKPSNNTNALRGFDFVANSLTVGNFVIGTDARYKNFSTRLAINIGMTPSQFYKQEPVTPASNMIPSLNSSTWQFIQEAIVSYDFEHVQGLSAQMGILATPIGLEGLPSFQTWENSSENHHMHKKDYRVNWNFSRSNSFIHVPDYHSGIRLLYSPNERSTYSFYVVNGQNMVTDNNVDKTIAVSYLWTPKPNFHLSALYMGGNERPTGSAEGKSWRHLFDFHTRFNLSRNVTFMAQFIPGFETTNFGTNTFSINALYLKYDINKKTNLAFRYEQLLEKIAYGSNSNFLQSFNEKSEAGLFGFTGTCSHILVKDHLMVRLEYRQDYGTQNWFFKGDLQPSGDDYYPYLTNANRQNTLSFSAVGWF